MGTAIPSTGRQAAGPLDAEQVEAFIEQGFTTVVEAFPRSTADAICRAH